MRKAQFYLLLALIVAFFSSASATEIITKPEPWDNQFFAIKPFARHRKGGFALLPFIAPILAGLATGATSYATQRGLKKVAGGRRRKVN